MYDTREAFSVGLNGVDKGMEYECWRCFKDFDGRQIQGFYGEMIFHARHDRWE